MITAPSEGRLRVITQTAHQEQCGLIAAAWGNAAFARPGPWEPVVRAARVHDEGWRAWEEAPDVDADGHPRGFTDMCEAVHCRIHDRSAALARDEGSRVGLVVGMHVAGLPMRRLGLDGPMPAPGERGPAVGELVRSQALHARRARAAIGEGAEVASWAWAAYRILQAVDLLSLYLTWRGLASADAWTLPRVPRCPGDEQGTDLRVRPAGPLACRVSPWPFGAPRVSAPVECRIIEDRAYEDAAALSAALSAAPMTRLDMEILSA